MVYTGTAAYKLVITDSADAVILSLDNIKGALDTSAFLTTGSISTLIQPVVTKTSNYTILAADRSKLIQGNTTSGQFTLTLTAAATLGDNWSCKMRNSGTANQLILSASEAISFEGGTFTARAFQPGEGGEIICDGTAFKLVGYTPPLMASRAPAVIAVVTRITAAPGSPTAGTRYLVSTGFSSYATGDIIESNGATFNKYTPATDCGWLAYVQDEDALYQFQNSVWVCLKATTAQAQAGTDNAAFMTALAVRNALPARAYSEYTTHAALATVIPSDDTIPQNTEGTQILSVSITPKSTSSRIRLRFQGQVSTGSATAVATAALFQDAIANALAASCAYADTTSDLPGCVVLEFEHAPATVSAITYTIRVGASSGNLFVNGSNAARIFGATSRATLIAEEVLT